MKRKRAFLIILADRWGGCKKLLATLAFVWM